MHQDIGDMGPVDHLIVELPGSLLARWRTARRVHRGRERRLVRQRDGMLPSPPPSVPALPVPAPAVPQPAADGMTGRFDLTAERRRILG